MQRIGRALLITPPMISSSSSNTLSLFARMNAFTPLHKSVSVGGRFLSTMTTNWNAMRRVPSPLTIRADDEAAGGKAAEKKTSKKKEAKARKKINFAKVYPQLKLDELKITDVPLEFKQLVAKCAWETIHKPEPTLQDGKKYFRTIRRRKIKESNAMREMGIQIK